MIGDYVVFCYLQVVYSVGFACLLFVALVLLWLLCGGGFCVLGFGSWG